jgi:REP element-mobilizing transposase RayT
MLSNQAGATDKQAIKPYNKDALWSPSYFASSVDGAPIDIISGYTGMMLTVDG